jgi:predicted transcriptional regulator
MPDRFTRHLSRRERQIMDIIYARGKAAAAEVHEALPDVFRRARPPAHP